MRFWTSFSAVAAVVSVSLLPPCLSLSSTDFPQDGDVPQSGYSDNHNFDPTTLSQYKVNWTKTFNTAEFFYAKPLVYTPAGETKERVYVVSNQNVVRVLDGMTGNVLVNRTLDPPFAASDTQCGDIANYVGIIGTPIIDTATEIMYFWSKSYVGGTSGAQGVPTGLYNGDWRLFAVRISDLSDTPGFPVSIRGLNAHNDRTRYPIAGTMNQRPGLAMVGNIIVSGFGSHCNNFNVTGYLVTASKTPGVGITDIQAMVAAPGATSPQATDIMSQTNGKSGIWQAGFGLAVDTTKNNVYFATGNGQGKGQLGGNGPAVQGSTYLSTIENSVASYHVDPDTGVLTQTDWWTPTIYDSVLNGADRDMSSSGVALLDPVFSGGGVERIAIASGKNGTVVIMDANNLGGFANGPGGSDGVLQGINMNSSTTGADPSFFGGVASYPLEGGYIYFVPTDDSLYAYKFGLRADTGKPFFTWAGKTAMVFAGKGAPRVTSLNGQAGTGILWLSDVNQGVVAYNPIPVNGVLVPYTFPLTGRLNKFHRPSFGNARVYTAESNQILAIGGLVSPPNSGVTSSSTSVPVSSSTASVSLSSSSSLSSSTSLTITSTSTSTSTSMTTTSSSSSTQTTVSSTSSSIQTTSSSTIQSTDSSTSSTDQSSSTSVSSQSSSSSVPITTSSTSASSTSVTSTSSSSSSTPTQTGPAIKNNIDPSWVFQGCWTESTTGRALSSTTYANDSMTLESCAAFCTGYLMFGVEYGRECYCGNTLSDGSVKADNQADCNFLCPGDPLEYCGAGVRLELYSSMIATSTSSTSQTNTQSTSTSTSTSDCAAPTTVTVTMLSTITQTWVSTFTGSCLFTSSSESFSTSATVSQTSSDDSSTSSLSSSLTTSSFSESTVTSTDLSSSTTSLSSSTTELTTDVSSSSSLSSSTTTESTFSQSSSSTTDISSSTSSEISSSSTGVSSSSISSISSSSSQVTSSSSVTLTLSTSSTTVSSSSTSTTPAAYVTPSPPSGDRITFNWNIGWVNAAPDGYTRPLIGINGQWPPPALVVNYGDTIVLNVVNGLGNQSTSIHFHGIFQRNTTFEDGPTFTTQCPIPPGESFVYQFTATQIGTYWWHGHHAGQYIDGLRGPLIIKNKSPPYGPVNQDTTLTLSDHYHEEAPYLINTYQSVENTNDNGGIEPVPDSNLMNDTQNVKFNMVAGQTNLFRIINMGAVAGQYIQFDQHTMTIVEIDGQYVQPYDAEQIFIAVAQRYSVIIKSKSDSSQNFAVVATMNAQMFYGASVPANPTVYGWLVYNSANTLPDPFTLVPQPFSDTDLVPLDQEALMDPPDQTLYIAADFNADENGITRGFLNGVTYVAQKVPTLYTALTAPSQYLNNAEIYGTGSNPYVLPYGSIIEIQVTNHDSRAHPFHLHGHAFQVIYRYGTSLFPSLLDTPAIPMKRDTLTVFANSAATIRFVADNPGIQLFHCHTEWHVVSGMVATFIEAPTELVAQKPYIPVSHRTVCDNYGISRKGNAAGNSNDWLDLTGANTEAPTVNWGALDNPPS